MSEQWSADELMIVNAAPAQLRDDSGVLRRHRAAVDGRQPRPPHARDEPHADLRVGLHRLEADAAAAVDRRRRARRHRPTRSVSVPEIFAYWLQAGRIDIGFLGGAQLDKYGNINSTVIGDYEHPKTRLPGAGGAPEIAASAGEVIVIMRQSGAQRSSSAATSAPRSASATARATASGSGLRGARAADRHHRPRHPAARSRDLRARADRAASRRHRASRRSPRPAGRCGSPTTLEVTDPPTANELAALAALRAA